ncbi:coagulation factor XI-like [Topomyia yanbarensis]|uniref:coagulation factor XI-like n=1 Tax=Topomyia yanbarensis TaxID=2498891 RepID=UPI00273C9D84|nr:coagulation factor XI-like [Topomyia yanbarensis]
MITLTQTVLILYTLSQLGHGTGDSAGQPTDEIECGVRFRVKPPGNWPFHVLLVTYPASPSLAAVVLCGGTVIGMRTVLTAAHCVLGSNRRPVNVSSVVIYAAIYNLSSLESTPRHSVESIIIHPEYSTDTLTNDVALLRLDDIVGYNQLVQPVCLWPSDRSGSRKIELVEATAIGWGIDATGSFSNALKECNQRLPSMDECRMQFGRILLRNESLFCARTKVCRGSGGSGLYVQRKGRMYLRGIVLLGPPTSASSRCGDNKLTVFLDMGKHYDWIRQQLFNDLK